MNNKAQMLFFSLMLCVVILILALAFAPIIKQFITNAATDMGCNNSGIDDYTKANCFGLDISIWFYILLFIVLAFTVLGSKYIGN